MPDGLELHPLDGGKLEVMQEIMEAASEDEISEDNLGHCMVMLYASKYDDVKDMDVGDIAEAGREIALRATLEDRQAAEEIIIADFDALQASIASSPKGAASTRAGRNHLNGQASSGPDSHLDTQEKTSTESLPSKSSKSVSQNSTQTETKESASSGKTKTQTNSQEQGKDLSDCETVDG